jgi:hypothetical protein
MDDFSAAMSAESWARLVIVGATGPAGGFSSPPRAHTARTMNATPAQANAIIVPFMSLSSASCVKNEKG